MPLSDSERKRLQELEDELGEQDPRLALKLSTSPGRFAFGHKGALGLTVAILGVIVVLVGVAFQLTIVGVVGFAAMIVGTNLILSDRRPDNRHHGPPRNGHSALT